MFFAVNRTKQINSPRVRKRKSTQVKKRYHSLFFLLTAPCSRYNSQQTGTPEKLWKTLKKIRSAQKKNQHRPLFLPLPS